MQLRSDCLVISSSNTFTIDPSQFDALTQQLVQLQAQLATVQIEVLLLVKKAENCLLE